MCVCMCGLSEGRHGRERLQMFWSQSHVLHMQGKKPAWVRSLTCGQVQYTSCMPHISDETLTPSDIITLHKTFETKTDA